MSVDTLLLVWNDIDTAFKIYSLFLGKIYAGKELQLSLVAVTAEALVGDSIDDFMDLNSCSGRHIEYDCDRMVDFSKYFDLSNIKEVPSESDTAPVCVAFSGLVNLTSSGLNLIVGTSNDEGSGSRVNNDNDVNASQHKTNLLLMLESLSPSSVPRIREIAVLSPSPKVKGTATSTIVVGVSVPDYELGVKALIHLEGMVIGGNAVVASLAPPFAWTQNEKREQPLMSSESVQPSSDHSESGSLPTPAPPVSILSALSREFVPSFLKNTASNTVPESTPPTVPSLDPKTAALGAKIASTSRLHPPRQPRAPGKLVPGVKVCYSAD
jgi:hypothetical protein